jgi:tetrahydromethanopterin:alpha-L-glutamate ligase
MPVSYTKTCWKSRSTGSGTVAPVTTRQVVIFSDEPGWHGRSLRREMAVLGIESCFVSLCACGFDLSGPQPEVLIPGFRRLPDAAFVRGVAGGTLEEIIVRLDVLHALEILGVPVFNSGRAIERTVDKGLTSFLLHHRGIPSPRTWVCESVEQARTIARRELDGHRALVLKPLFGSQGNGVIRVSTLDEFDAYAPPSGVFYLQEFQDSGDGGFRDWRVFVIDGRAVAAMQRRSRHWVTNRAQGAVCEAIGSDPALFALAEAAAAAVEVDYAGVDLMRDRNGNWLVGEVNGIPAWQGLQRVSQANVTRRLVGAFAAKMNRHGAFAATG